MAPIEITCNMHIPHICTRVEINARISEKYARSRRISGLFSRVKPPNYAGLPLTAAQNRNRARDLIAVYVRYFARDLANSRRRFAFYGAGKARESTGNMRELAVIRENPRNFA